MVQPSRGLPYLLSRSLSTTIPLGGPPQVLMKAIGNLISSRRRCVRASNPKTLPTRDVNTFVIEPSSKRFKGYAIKA